MTLTGDPADHRCAKSSDWPPDVRQDLDPRPHQTLTAITKLPRPPINLAKHPNPECIGGSRLSSYQLYRLAVQFWTALGYRKTGGA